MVFPLNICTKSENTLGFSLFSCIKILMLGIVFKVLEAQVHMVEGKCSAY